MDNVNSAYLMHHGIKGMKWGVRRFEDANGHLTEAGKRRYAIQDARKYYKINRLQRAKEHTKNTDKSARLSKRLRKVKTRSDRKHSDLNQKDINAGREIVAKNRLKWAGFNTAAKAALTAAGAAYLYQNPNTRALAPLALAGGAALTAQSAKKVPYYFMENRRYKQVNEKGATTKGLTERQKKLRKVGKTALAVGLGAAAIGGGAYAATKYRNAKLTRNTINNASSATKEILKANRKASFSRARKNVANKAKSSIASGAKKAASNTRAVINTGRRRTTDNLKERLTEDIDIDDLGSVIRGVKRDIDYGRDIYDKATFVKQGGVPAATALAMKAGIDKSKDVVDKYKNSIFKLRNK